MSDLLLSRTLHPKDYDQLGEELAVVDEHGINGQANHQRWEYALALHAVWRWQEARRRPVGEPCYDIGGAGKPFPDMLAAWCDADEAIVIDPTVGGRTVDDGVCGGKPLADVVTCLSIVEHVEHLDDFLYRLGCLVAPGGLLVLTMPFWNRCGADTAHGHHTRRRIFCPKTYAQLRATATVYQLMTFGGVDPTYHGAQVHDYTVASLVLEKRR